MLKQLVDNGRTDKDTIHSYLDTYERLFSPLRTTATQVLEIGIQRGGSIKLWHDYFPSATIHGVDVEPTSLPILRAFPRVRLYERTDAYNPSFVESLRGLQFDVLIDDGPHSLESMQAFLRLYVPLMSDRSVLIIEDVQDVAWLPVLSREIPQDPRLVVDVYDLRSTKGRYDDVLFVVKKTPA
jgi:cephalosporin hydroxylase